MTPYSESVPLRHLPVNLWPEHPYHLIMRVQAVTFPTTHTPQLPPLLPNVVTPKLKMPMINFPVFDGSGHVLHFLVKFYNFKVTYGLPEQQIILLVFAQSKCMAVDWYTFEVGNILQKS